MADAGDYGYLWAWEPLQPEEIAQLLAGFARPWWICGGWALDLSLGRETRRHDDLDVALLRQDQLALFHHLRAWDLYYATPTHALEPWDGGRLELPTHGIWARRSTEPTASWTCEFLLNEERDGEWVFRRNEARVHHLIGSYGLDSGVSAAAFLCSIIDGSPTVPSTGEIAEVRWWPAGELPWPRSNLLHYAVPDAVAGRRGVQRIGLPRIN